MKIIRLFFVLSFLFSLNSCKLIESLTELNKTTPKIHELKEWDKDILFLPMHHMGKPEFYDKVKEIVKNKKKDDFRVYYELVSTDFTDDDSLRNEIRRKARKIKGFSGTYKDNASGSYFSKYIQQPSYADLGIDSMDVWADVDYLQLITYWEEVNGKIILDSTDMNTPFNVKLDRGVSYTKDEYNKVFIDFRNKHLISLIKNNSDKKILILYGKGHYKNFRKQLKSASKS